MTSPVTTAPVRSPFGAARLWSGRYRGVRWRADVGFEMRCDVCPNGARYWPITEEYWNVKHGLSRCAACWLTYWRRKAVTTRNRDIELVRARDRAKYRRNRKVIILKRREYYQRNREAILARRRAWYAAKVAA